MGLLKRLLLAALNQSDEHRDPVTALAVRPSAQRALPPPYERRGHVESYFPLPPKQAPQGRELQRLDDEAFPQQYAPRDFYEVIQPPPPVQPRRRKVVITERITRREG
jgi:hypothetical protein